MLIAVLIVGRVVLAICADAAEPNKSRADSVAAEPFATEADKAEFQQQLNLTLKFHDDWRKTRHPLSPIRRENIYVRTLVADDIVERLDSRETGESESVETQTSDEVEARSQPFAERLQNRISVLGSKHAYPIILRGAESPSIGHVDCEVDYQCMCSPEHTYNPIAADSVPTILPRYRPEDVQGLRAKIDAIASGVAYDCYDVVNHLEGFRTEKRCRFVTRLRRVTDASTMDSMLDSRTWVAFEPSNVTEMVVESAVRVHPLTLSPLERPSNFERPIYAVGGDRLFFFEEVFHDPGIRCAISKLFDNPVFDVTRCNQRELCTANAMKVFLPILDNEMKLDPLGADVDTSDSFAPGERCYKREYKKSIVLGAAYYESSQYILGWYRNRVGDVAPPGLFTYSGGAADHPGDRVFVKIKQSLSVRAGLAGSYPEATRQQYARYEEAVRDVVAKAIEGACARLMGAVMVGRVCVLPEA